MSRITLALLILIALSGFMNAEDIAWQGFEGSPDDSWAYQTNSVTSGYWGLMDDEFGGASPQSGSQYWASWNMGGNEGIISFANQNLPVGYVYSLSFYFYTRLLSSPAEYSRYCLSYDNGLTWTDWTTLLPNTQAWTLVSLEIPVQHRQLMLKVAAKHGGTSKYAHWDSFLLSRVPAPPQAPVIYNLQIAQRIDGSGLVDIHYDLFDANNNPADISLLLSSSGGTSFEISPDPAFLSGDIGIGIPLGEGKHIIWNAGAQGIALESDQYRFRLLAEDGTTYGTVATPVFDPPGGVYSTTQYVTITSATDGSNIRFTTDGSEPNETSAIYITPIIVSANTIIKAKAYKEGWIDSVTGIAEYMVSYYVLVAGGTFNNGTSNVTISSFYMDKHELTQAFYQAVMGNNPASGHGVGSNYPVYYVSWFDAIEYCNRRSMQEGFSPCYSYDRFGTNPDYWPAGWNASDGNHTNVECNWTANGYRLSTEMEWMFAARGGNQTHSYTYSGSDDINAVAWYSSNSGSTTHIAGTKAANELGTFDMSGNVWEWVWDIYGSYPSSAQTNPHGATSGSNRVRRGGSVGNVAANCTVAFRYHSSATYSAYSVGIRCVRRAP